MSFSEYVTERPPCNNGERNATLEEAARAVENLSPVATDSATVGMAIRAIRALKSHAPASAPTHGERIADLIWAQLEDRPLGLARAPEERKRDLAAAIDAALAEEERP
jgi:hypothetical protein